MLDLDIICDEPRWGDADALGNELRHWAGAAADAACREQQGRGAFSAVLKLADDAEVQALNRQFRGQDKPTNVLSFPSGDDWPDDDPMPDGDVPEPTMLGDIIIAFETVAREAEEQQKPFRHHLAHLVVHGILHLYGFDHIDDAEAEEMERLECEVLARFAIPSPYETASVNDM